MSCIPIKALTGLCFWIFGHWINCLETCNRNDGKVKVDRDIPSADPSWFHLPVRIAPLCASTVFSTVPF